MKKTLLVSLLVLLALTFSISVLYACDCGCKKTEAAGKEVKAVKADKIEKADCPCTKDGECKCDKKGDCPCAKGGECKCDKKGGCPCAKDGECKCDKKTECPKAKKSGCPHSKKAE